MEIQKPKMKKRYSLIVVFFIFLIISLGSIFIVRETEQAVVFQFGNPVREIKNTGLNFKIPFLQEVVYFDNRIQKINTEEKEVIASDQKRIIITAFTNYKIVDPLLYYTTVHDDRGFKNKFGTIFDSSMRQVIGEVSLNTLLSDKRYEIMQKIQEVMDSKAHQFGIQIIDVRITKSDLPKANSNAIYQRMQSDREREAKEIRAEGDEAAQKIIATADKEKTLLLSEAKKQAEIIKGEGDAAANKIYAKAYSQDYEFFEFYRSMQAYKKSLKNENTKIITTQDNGFLKNI